MRKFKQLTWNDRLKIETMILDGKEKKEIAERIQVHISTIYREVKRGRYEHKNSDWTMEERYSPEIADKKYRVSLSEKGSHLKIGKDHKLAQYIENKIIKEKYSPAAVLGEVKNMEKEFSTTICVTTLYSYIDKGLFLNLTNKNLVVKGERKRKCKKIRPKRAPKGDSIEKRPKEIDDRTTFGHWEMDSVVGKKGKNGVLLVLTERLSREEIELKVKDGTSESVVKALNMLERRYGRLFYEIFKSITVDNGSEFADCEGMEKSIHGGKRTKIYYCHPYSSWERGSNENGNKLIRRHFPKGTDFSKVTEEQVARAEEWQNNYPRRILGYRTAENVFNEHLENLKMQA
ncbi:IS30 family transposase [Clostridia bacterium]|nr:IS30 family transposase [Clostridia bacterium]